MALSCDNAHGSWVCCWLLEIYLDSAYHDSSLYAEFTIFIIVLYYVVCIHGMIIARTLEL